MHRIGFERWGRWGAGAFVLLTLVLFVAQPAQAGCRPFASGSSDSSIAPRLDAFLNGETMLAHPIDATADPRPGQAPIPAAPCSGPGCSSRDPAPASSATTDTDLHDRWGEASQETSPPRAICWTAAIEGPTARPIVTKPSIFHPPPRSLDARPGSFAFRGR